MSVVCAAFGDQVDACALCLSFEAMLMFKILAAINDHVVVCGPCCDWRLYGCLRSILSKEPMLIPIVQVTTKGRVDVCGLGYLWRPCCFLWPGLLLRAIMVPTVCVLISMVCTASRDQAEVYCLC